LGKKAARLFYAALEKKDKTTVEAALKAYEQLIPQERIGDEYTAFEWFCKYLLASKEQQTQMLRDRFDAEYFDYLANDDFALLKKYLRTKYDLAKADPETPRTGDEFSDKRVRDVTYEYSGTEVSFDQLNEWNEFVAFNNPNRESWEKTTEMLDYVGIKDGEAVADVGCGFGFFSFKFSQLVGQNGKVYATEVNKNALAHVEKISSKFGLNIETIQSRFNDARLPRKSVDTIFMCSMYHAVYIASIEFVKDQFIASLKKALRKGGRLVIVDNAITPPSVVAYHGSGIAKELVISQLKYYGFRLVGSKQLIPQRYVLIFQQG
jgi:predicted methyltransferase